MYQFLLMAHSGWRYIVLLALAVAIIKYLIGWIAKSQWANFDVTMNRLTPIAVDIQWLLGLIIWFMGSWWQNSMREIAWEHPFTMTLALVAAHLTARFVKSADNDRRKFMVGTLGYLATGALVAAGVYLIVGGLVGSRV